MNLAQLWKQNFDTSWAQAEAEVEQLKANFKPTPWVSEITQNLETPLEADHPCEVYEMCYEG